MSEYTLKVKLVRTEVPRKTIVIRVKEWATSLSEAKKFALFNQASIYLLWHPVSVRKA